MKFTPLSDRMEVNHKLHNVHQGRMSMQVVLEAKEN